MPPHLFEIYLSSVGRGSTLLLNVPPDKEGRIHQTDVAALEGCRKLLNETFKNNLAANAKTKADSYRGENENYAAANVTDGNKETYWATDDEKTTGAIEIDLGKTQLVKYVVLQEYIKLGQRVKSFTIEAWKENAWQEISEATTIGNKRIVKLNPIETDRLRVTIVSSKACPLISNVEVY